LRCGRKRTHICEHVLITKQNQRTYSDKRHGRRHVAMWAPERERERERGTDREGLGERDRDRERETKRGQTIEVEHTYKKMLK